MTRTVVIAVTLLTAAVAIGGCDDIISDRASQAGTIGDPTVVTERCFFGGISASPPYTCESVGGFNNTQTIQGLVAYQVPTAVREPATLTGATDAAGGNRRGTYTFSQSYTDALQADSPAPPGMRWRGYISEAETYTPAQEVPQVDTITARFAMPRGADGSPAHGPFQWLTVVGMRYDGTDLSPDRPVGGCGGGLTTGYVSPGQASPIVDTFCVDYPKSLPPLSSLQTSDFGITAPAAGAAQAGGAADVPFGWELAGPAVGAPFSLSASTDVPGGAATPADATLSPGAGSRGTEPVHVTVPASTPPGDYLVGLRATLASGESRSGTAQIHVGAGSSQPGVSAGPGVGPDHSAPRLTLAGLGHARLRGALAHGLPVELGCSEPCRLSVALLLARKTARQLHLASAGPVRIGARTVALSGAGHRTVRIGFTKKARKRLRAAHSVVLTVKVAGADAAGNAAVASRAVKLR